MCYISCHVETNGVNFDTSTRDINDGYRVVSVGLVACNENFEVQDEIIIFNYDVDSTDTEKYHGISNKFLSKYGVSEEEVAVEVSQFIISNTNVNRPIKLIGHNIATFSLPFLKQLLLDHDMSIQFSSNTIDTYSMLIGTMGEYSLSDVVEAFATEDQDEKYKRKELSALHKAHIFVNICQMMRELGNAN